MNRRRTADISTFYGAFGHSGLQLIGEPVDPRQKPGLPSWRRP